MSDAQFVYQMPSNTRFHFKKAVSFQVPPLISEYFTGGTKIGVFYHCSKRREGGVRGGVKSHVQTNL